MFRSKLFGIFLLFLLISLTLATRVTAEDTKVTDDILNQKQAEIAKIEAQLEQSKKQENTLTSQLDFIDGQTKLAELKIDQAKYQIAKLDKEITDLDGRIDRLNGSVDSITKVLLDRIVKTYKYSDVNAIDLIFSSGNFSELLTRIKYLQVIQANDRKVLLQLQATKDTYHDQKSDKENRSIAQQKLQKDLAVYQEQLNNQKSEKDKLLNAVKNDSAKYQTRLKELQREIAQIQNAAATLISTEPRHVNKGDLIGLMGNSGYSTGAHLHFGVYNVSKLEDYNYYSNYENPENVLSATGILWDEQPDCSNKPAYNRTTGRGSWAWPMETGSLHVSQGFGDTCYSGRLYGGKPHPALDMYNNSSIGIHAVEEGMAYSCRNCLKDGGNGIFLFHPNGKMTLYWHLQ